MTPIVGVPRIAKKLGGGELLIKLEGAKVKLAKEGAGSSKQ